VPIIEPPTEEMRNKWVEKNDVLNAGARKSQLLKIRKSAMSANTNGLGKPEGELLRKRKPDSNRKLHLKM